MKSLSNGKKATNVLATFQYFQDRQREFLMFYEYSINAIFVGKKDKILMN